MKVLVIDPEEITVEKVKDLLFRIDESIRVVGVTANLDAAAHWLINNNRPDIILANETLLSANFPEFNRDIKASVTFSNNLEKYNYQALRYKTLSYLMKDADISKRLHQLTGTRTENSEDSIILRPYKERFLVKQGQKMISIPVSHIAYFFSHERFIFFKTFDKQKFLLEHRIEQLERMLSPRLFFRINRSFIISLDSVKEIHSYFGNRLKLYLHPPCDKDVLVSRKRVSDFKEWLGK